jgi:hypothetical protein
MKTLRILSLLSVLSTVLAAPMAHAVTDEELLGRYCVQTCNSTCKDKGESCKTKCLQECWGANGYSFDASASVDSEQSE